MRRKYGRQIPAIHVVPHLDPMHMKRALRVQEHLVPEMPRIPEPGARGQGGDVEHVAVRVSRDVELAAVIYVPKVTAIENRDRQPGPRIPFPKFLAHLNPLKSETFASLRPHIRTALQC